MNKKTTRLKTDAAEHFVPQSREETSEAILQIGMAQRERARIEAAMNDEMAGIKKRYEEEAKPYSEKISSLIRGVQLWCEAHRDELTSGGKTKTANLASGEVKWRMRPPSVRLSAGDTVIEALIKMGLNRFIRTKQEVNKEAILLEPAVVEHIKGISVTQKEDFVVEPFESKLEEVV